jgi:hypothetical protein
MLLRHLDDRSQPTIAVFLHVSFVLRLGIGKFGSHLLGQQTIRMTL